MRFSLDLELLARARQWAICLAIAILVIHYHFFPIIMGIGSFLGMLYIGIAWRSIRWKDWLPLLLLELFYVFSVINIRGELNPNMYYNTNWPEMQLGFALVPFMFVGLRPKRCWATIWVLSSVAIFTAALVVASYNSFQMVEGAIRFIPYSVEKFGMNLFSPWQSIISGFSFFSYMQLARNVGVWPAFLCYCLVVSLIVVLHRMYKERTKFWSRLLLCAYLLLGIFLCNTRMMFLCLLVMCGILFIRMLVRKDYRPIPIWLLAASAACVIAVFFVGSRGGVIRVRQTTKDDGGFMSTLWNDILRKDPRIDLWICTWHERDAFLPWGLGSGECGNFIKEHYYDKYGDAVGNHYEGVVDRKGITIVQMHNMFLDTAVEQGYPGLFYLLFMLVVPLLRVGRMKFIHILLYVSLLVLISFESVVYSVFAIAFFTMIYCALIAYSNSSSASGSLRLPSIRDTNA